MQHTAGYTDGPAIQPINIGTVRKRYLYIGGFSLHAENTQLFGAVVIPFQDGNIVGIIRLCPKIILARQNLFLDPV